MHARLCRTDGDRCAPVPAAVATYFGADQPRITAEVRIPWDALGVEGPPPARSAWSSPPPLPRARWMSSSGQPPAAALADPAGLAARDASAPLRPEAIPVRHLLGRAAAPDAERAQGRPIGTRATTS